MIDRYSLILRIESLRKLGIPSFFKHNQEYRQSLMFHTSYLPQSSKTNERVYHILNSLDQIPKCTICGQDYAQFKRLQHREDGKAIYEFMGYGPCSKSCTAKLRNYRAKAASQTDEARAKKRATNLERYGSEDHMKSDLIREKVSKLQRAIQDERGLEIAAKREATNLRKYGATNVASTQHIKDKTRKHFLDKYGVEHNLQIPKVKDHIKKTMLRKYGVVNYAQSDTAKSHLSQLMTKKYEHVHPGYSVISVNQDGTRTYEHIHCKNRFTCKPSDFNARKSKGLVMCTHCKPLSTNTSQAESEISEYLSSIGVHHKRNVKMGYSEVDIHMPEIGISLDFNGLYWHSELQKDKMYHKDKILRCKEELGTDLFYIWEHEWTYQPQKIKMWLKNMTIPPEFVYYARKCTIREVSIADEKLICDTYHLQGYRPSSHAYGLYVGDELLQMMSFVRTKSDNYDIQRFVTKSNHRVTGGFTKLLHHFLRNHKISRLRSFVDMAKFRGQSYQRVKASKVWTNPGYFYTKSSLYFTRQTFMKHKLPAINGFDFDPNLTESQNCNANGYYRVFDAGQLRFIIEPDSY